MAWAAWEVRGREAPARVVSQLRATQGGPVQGAATAAVGAHSSAVPGVPWCAGGGKGKNGRSGGFFGMVKANITTVDKNAKDKVGGGGGGGGGL